MRRVLKQGASLVIMALLITACGTKRPVLYPNEHLRNVGNDAALRDIDQCLQMAREYGANRGKADQVAEDTAKAAAVGGATGAVIGAIAGGAGEGAAIGAGGAATAALVSGAFDAHEPDPIFMQFVDQCLWEKGYQPIGWR